MNTTETMEVNEVVAKELIEKFHAKLSSVSDDAVDLLIAGTEELIGKKILVENPGTNIGRSDKLFKAVQILNSLKFRPALGHEDRKREYANALLLLEINTIRESVERGMEKIVEHAITIAEL